MPRDIDKVIGALDSPVRREILALVWDRELAAGEIAGAFPRLSKPTISEHLRVLRDAELVAMTVAGTSRRYRARQETLAGMHAALEGSFKWTPADDIPEQTLAETRTGPVVVSRVEVETDQATTFAAFTDPAVYARWLGSPVTITEDGRFAATMEWGTEVRGTYDLVCPPELIVMRWDFEDDTVPVPGAGFTGYLRVRPAGGGSVVEVHQLVDTPAQAAFMEVAWGAVLGRLRVGVAAASRPEAPMPRRPHRPKRRRTA